MDTQLRGIRTAVLPDGSVLIQWAEQGEGPVEEAFEANELQVWPGENGRPSAVRLRLAEGLTPTALQRFPWARMLGTAEARWAFEARQEKVREHTRAIAEKLAEDPALQANLGHKPAEERQELLVTLVRAVRDELEKGAGDELDERLDGIWRGTKREAAQPAPAHPGRKGHPDSFYQEVAERYIELRAEGRTNPTTWIARERLVSRDTVSDWVRGARGRGYLPPAQKGRAG